MAGSADDAVPRDVQQAMIVLLREQCAKISRLEVIGVRMLDTLMATTSIYPDMKHLAFMRVRVAQATVDGNDKMVRDLTPIVATGVTKVAGQLQKLETEILGAKICLRDVSGVEHDGDGGGNPTPRMLMQTVLDMAENTAALAERVCVQ